MSTEELTLVVIITTRPGKGQRVRYHQLYHDTVQIPANFWTKFLDLSTEAYKTFEKKEPWCLQFQIVRSTDVADDSKEQRWAIIERYA